MSHEYKGYNIENDGSFGYKSIKPIGKGSVHLGLRGSYTTELAARRAIDYHLDTKVDKGGKPD